jgi:hypothetical protein
VIAEVLSTDVADSGASVGPEAARSSQTRTGPGAASLAKPAHRQNTTRGPTRCTLILSAVGMLGALRLAHAADPAELAQRLVGPFLAEDVAVICTQRDPSFFRNLDERFDSANSFAQHVKFEVTGALSLAEATVVLRAAADMARAKALIDLRSMQMLSPTLEASNIDKWCATSARQIVIGALQAHVRSHLPPER